MKELSLVDDLAAIVVVNFVVEAVVEMGLLEVHVVVGSDSLQTTEPVTGGPVGAVEFRAINGKVASRATPQAFLPRANIM